MSLVLGFVTLVNVCVFYLIFCILYIGCGHIPNQSPIAATLLQGFQSLIRALPKAFLLHK